MKIRQPSTNSYSPSLQAPCSSSSGTDCPSPLFEETKELNTYRLAMALLKLKRCPKYSDATTDIKVEQSIDGSCKVYLRPGPEPGVSVTIPSPALHRNGGTLSPQSAERVVARLRELAAKQEDESPANTPRLEISLDNCTFIYFPEASTPDSLSDEMLPASVDNSTPDKVYYNLKSPRTLRFIQKALISSPKKRKEASSVSDFSIEESIDKSIILVKPKEDPLTLPKTVRKSQSFMEGMNVEDSISPTALINRLEALDLEGQVEQAIGEDTTLITEQDQSIPSSGSQSSILATPVACNFEHIDLSSPATNLKLLRKLYAIKEDCEGEDGIRDLSGFTVLYLNSIEGLLEPNSARNPSSDSPNFPQERREPQLERVVQELNRLYEQED
jgi:hypothetical protein